ncbi:MAG: hypothetical protein HRU20_06715 [Pseudomonadales bacterium]|nr:hypothetical protein [Pseudomonadales bacterium]
MNVVGVIPYWLEYQLSSGRDDHKNLKMLGGRYLINYSLSLLQMSACIDHCCLYVSDDKVLQYTDDDFSAELLIRPEFLDANDITIEDIIDEFLQVSDADVIVMLHPNSPFLRLNTLDECIKKVVSGEFDSAFTAYEYKKLSWFDGKPLNYSLLEPTPKLETLKPVIFEQSSLYVFSRQSYLKNRKRVGENPYIKCINHFEGHEINDSEDFEMAELIVNSGMYSAF